MPPPPPSASRRRTTSSTSSNPTAALFDSAINGQHFQPPPSVLVEKQISSSTFSGAGESHSIGSFESPALGSDPFDTSHATRLVNGVGATHHHASSTPILRYSSSSSPPLGAGSISLEMSQAPSAIMGPRSSAGDFSSPSSTSVFGTPAQTTQGKTLIWFIVESR